jgi:hypothetical protein
MLMMLCGRLTIVHTQWQFLHQQEMASYHGLGKVLRKLCPMALQRRSAILLNEVAAVERGPTAAAMLVTDEHDGHALLSPCCLDTRS